ncbi:BZ3500_MvSof-1268-A1-R1_Chr9g10885 [Microbotryum saponariae]|uniref:BZ3500_MvSof-1268-A1-R1_Chr9g10885 protein n=1 Tax=Microbotryum saponariae TaxID=289078 RepID=A0A2X0KDT2_9BASI|nr:BZ3501_MvSof-1269-A2-R1_Chr9g10633 [Microbotryum saponariae]SDA00861.1 BZ3500_MvSof-1268-A1-R1_Chr9g10885 [Microbotryum saponariae]
MLVRYSFVALAALIGVASALDTKEQALLEVRANRRAAKTTSSQKGLGYNTASLLSQFERRKSLAWAYNWANSVNNGNQPALSPEVDFVPMLWGSDATGWSAAAKKRIAQGGKYLLGFNEPDLPSQSNITPARAAQLWKQNMEPFVGKARLVSPAVTNGAFTSDGAPMGVNWMADFLDNCTRCHIDAIALHWYDAAWNTGYFFNYLTDAHKKFNKPIWLTEFAGSGTTAEQQAFLKKVIPWLEKTPWIQRYAGFGAFAGQYVNANGGLTAIGDTYMRTV